MGSNTVQCNAFLDSGSNVSFCTEELADLLQASGNPIKLKLNTMGNQVEMNSKSIKGLIVSALHGEENMEVELPIVYTKPSLPVQNWQIPSREDVESWKHLRGIELPKIDASIDILIGNNVPAAYAPREVRTGPQGSPYAIKTPLGWVAWGVMKPGVLSASHCTNLEKIYIESLNYDFPERCIDDKREWSTEDREFMRIMENSCKIVEGHYQVDLPLRNPAVQLPDNLQMVSNRLRGLQKKMEKNPQFKEDYIAFMEDIIGKGYSEEVSNGDNTRGANRGIFLTMGCITLRKGKLGWYLTVRQSLWEFP
ncbi:uncharacterized protein LOC117117891 [Anneissia japonica]|uniref:uncharacterized protein LOC117117891 n=1 Tax=Anneissia japonica TaxID=1529436 RepID=UPI0014259DC9|nr:uncharacterized protein LOC117117891 [Anneissia japonica]